jgi:fatty acid desaturase
MTAPAKEILRTLHRPDWFGAGKWLGFFAAFLILEGLLVTVLLAPLPRGGQWAAAGLLVLALGHFMHGHLIAFHEAAHGSLCPVRWLNETFGVFIGIPALMSLSLFRAVHHTHHAFLATEKDEELWPFVQPATPRWARRLAAFGELVLGLFYTPLLFLRAFLRPGTVIRERSVRRRIGGELALVAVVWTFAVAASAWWDLWTIGLFLYMLPAMVAGSMQTLRKYIEHMGLTGLTVLGVTRSVLPHRWTGRLVAFSLFNEPYHGTHHKYPRVPQAALPRLTPVLTPATWEPAPFPSYRHALADMLGTLGDPRIGAQWLRAPGVPFPNPVAPT